MNLINIHSPSNMTNLSSNINIASGTAGGGGGSNSCISSQTNQINNNNTATNTNNNSFITGANASGYINNLNSNITSYQTNRLVWDVQVCLFNLINLFSFMK